MRVDILTMIIKVAIYTSEEGTLLPKIKTRKQISLKKPNQSFIYNEISIFRIIARKTTSSKPIIPNEIGAEQCQHRCVDILPGRH